jgi:hypothetical protein
MNYRVFWFPDADRILDTLLKGSDKPAEFAAAAQEIDRQLASDPFNFGESRSERARIGISRPLAVHFEVIRDVSTVIVYNVWRTDQKRR